MTQLYCRFGVFWLGGGSVTSDVVRDTAVRAVLEETLIIRKQWRHEFTDDKSCQASRVYRRQELSGVTSLQTTRVDRRHEFTDDKS